MTQTSHTAEYPAVPVAPPAHLSPPARTLAGLRARLSIWQAVLVFAVALEATLDFRRLRQNGFANIFYSAGVKSELMSLHNFLFVSFDPGGLMAIDKPPVALWVQVASAKLFGFSPMSLLVPEAVIGVLTVVAVYLVVSRRFGPAAGVVSAVVLAVFPSFVAVSRQNGVDPLLILLLVLACGSAARAAETSRLRWLLLCAALVGLAFDTKTLAALLVVPGAALAYLVCTELALWRRLVHLLAAGALMVVVSGAWIAFVDLTPKSQRPYVGSSTDNTEFNLTFSYNGFGRVGGQVGGPGRVPHVVAPILPPGNAALAAPAPRSPAGRPVRRAHLGGPTAPVPRAGGRRSAAGVKSAPRPVAAAPGRTQVAHVSAAVSGVQPIPRRGRARFPSAFGGSTGPLRLLSTSLGGQDGWMLPFALAGLLTAAIAVRKRRDRQLIGLLVFGGWFACEALLLSFSKGIVHPYYVSALAPGAAAMCGAGMWAMSEAARRRDWRALLLPVAIAATAVVQYVLLEREHYLHALLPYLAGGLVLGVAATLVLPRWAAPALAATLAVLLVAPTAYSATLWSIPSNGTFPAAGPHAAGGTGGYGIAGSTLRGNLQLIQYVRRHHATPRWEVLTVASDTAAPLILLGLHAGALGGYSGTDPAVTGPGLSRLVAAGEARYVLLGGAYASRGGNRATRAVSLACPHIPAEQWRGTPSTRSGLVLFDCRGRAAALAVAG
jgi:4-amino-4-deoxy-L-arabinose transferase-like glycosyltransferase